MPAIVEFPTVVQDAVEDFGDLFSCEPQRRHFAEYLGEACRAMLSETLRTTLAWAIEQATEKSRSYEHVVAKPGLT